MRTPITLAALGLGLSLASGCAAPTSATLPNQNGCPISAFKWEASDHDFDHKVDAEYAEKIATFIDGDRAVYRATPSGERPRFQAATLFSQAPSKFVSSETFQYALRLRQLECAATSGPIANRREMIEERFGKLLDEVNAHRQTPVKAAKHTAPDFYDQNSSTR